MIALHDFPVNRSYYRELALLADAYDWARQSDLAVLSNLVDRMRGQPALFVGSGGNLAVARLAADLHERSTRMVARAVTPLELAGLPPSMEAGLMIFSAAARNPDARLAVRVATSGTYRPAALVTLRRPSDLPTQITASPIEIVTLAPPAGKDGFLATTSVLALATALVRCYLDDAHSLPGTLPAFANPPRARLKSQCLILIDPSHSCVAVDLETRLHETGLSAAQVADYRNFAHGRHVGLAKHLKSTTIVAFASPASDDLATVTLRQLPSEAEVVRIDTKTS